MKTTAEVCAAIGGAAEMFGNEEAGRLIAAAPDLLAALRVLVDRYDTPPSSDAEFVAARVAIAKAEGRS